MHRLLLDEVSAHLDPARRRALYDALARAWRAGLDDRRRSAGLRRYCRSCADFRCDAGPGQASVANGGSLTLRYFSARKTQEPHPLQALSFREDKQSQVRKKDCDDLGWERRHGEQNHKRGASKADGSEQINERLQDALDGLRKDVTRVEIWATALGSFTQAVPDYGPRQDIRAWTGRYEAPKEAKDDASAPDQTRPQKRLTTGSLTGVGEALFSPSAGLEKLLKYNHLSY